MPPLLSLILFGVLGGLIRALVGIAKYYERNKSENQIRFWYLFFSLLAAGLVGGMAGILTDADWRLALLMGYAGTDFLEGLYKIKMKQWR